MIQITGEPSLAYTQALLIDGESGAGWLPRKERHALWASI